MITAVSSLKLTAVEEKIMGALLKCNSYFALGSTLRVAGGWVRDKLLGLESEDMDIAIDNMTGIEYAEKVNAYLSSVAGLHASRIGKMTANPERSKHLETARVLIFGQEVDFVNLRSESYAEGSRIPHKIEFGTPTEDAHRRDITINSLFYNINQKTVEDFTEKGLKDLNEKVIRTPLNPRETFLDDPLRILRVARFASRFNFKIDPNIYECLDDSAVRSALSTKVSRERIGIELDKMLLGPNPLYAMEILVEFSLMREIFTLPTYKIAYDEMYGQTRNILRLLEELKEGKEWPALRTILGDIEKQRTCVLAAFLSPYCKEPQIGVGKSQILAAGYVVQTSLKLCGKDVKSVSTIIENIQNIVNYVENGARWKRSELGMMIRKLGEIWKEAFLVCCLYHSSFKSEHLFAIYEKLIDNVFEMGLQTAFELRPIINGKEIAQLLGIQNFKIGAYIEWLYEWQLENPTGTRDQAETFLRSLNIE